MSRGFHCCCFLSSSAKSQEGTWDLRPFDYHLEEAWVLRPLSHLLPGPSPSSRFRHLPLLVLIALDDEPSSPVSETISSTFYVLECVHAKSLLLCLTLCDPLEQRIFGAHQAPLSMGFSRQEYWSGLPCPPLGDLPDPGVEPAFLMSLALAVGFFTTSITWEAPLCT